MLDSRIVRGRRLRSALALSLLLAIVLAFAGSFVHTDDGCVVEKHCIACRWALATFSLPAASAVPVPCLQPLGVAPQPSEPSSSCGVRLEAPSRGPPPLA